MKTLFLCSAALVLSLGPAFAQDFPRTVTDRLGREVTLTAPPERVVCFTTACIHNLAVFGVLPVAASEDNKNAALDPQVFGARAEGIAVLEWTDGYDTEAVLALEPDLVVSWDGAEAYMPVSVLSESTAVYNTTTNQGENSLADFIAEVRAFGQLLGREADAQAFVRRTEARLAAYDAQTDGSATLIVLRAAPGGSDEFWIPPSCGVALRRLVTCLGEASDWTQTTSEGLLSFDPDVLVIEDWGEGVTLEELSRIPLWSELSAVKTGRVHLLSPSRTLDYSLLAVSNSLDAIMPVAYPDLFPEPLTDKQVQEILAQ